VPKVSAFGQIKMKTRTERDKGAAFVVRSLA
jgi:hypothetical protein